MKCWRGQSPKIMGPHNSIMKLHNSIYRAPLQIMHLYVNCGDQSPLEVHALKLNYTELHSLSHHWIII